MNITGTSNIVFRIMRSIKSSELIRTIKRQRFIFLLMAPGIIWYILFKYLPLFGISYAFTDYGLKRHFSFVGFENFRRLFESPGFWNAFGNTMLISFYNLVFYFPLPIILALCINEIFSVRIKRLIQFNIYVPHFFSWVIVGGIFTSLLSPQSGIVNDIVKILGGEPIFFMVSQDWFRTVLVSSHIWKDVGYGAVIYIATLSTVDTQLYDAAIVDGAGYWGKLMYITLPCLKSTIATMLLLTVARILMIFEQVLVLYNPAVYRVSEVLQTYSFTEGLVNGDIGFATSIGLFTAVVSGLLIFGCNKFSQKVFDESIL